MFWSKIQKKKGVLQNLTIILINFTTCCMQHRIQQIPQFSHPSSTLSMVTLCNLIETIQFDKKTKTRSTLSQSETESISSNHSRESKQKSKLWTPDQNELFMLLLKKYGTDFHILSNFFPKKTKNQLKNRYKQYFSSQKKRQREEVLKLKAVSMLFRQVEQKFQRDQQNIKND